MKLNAEYVYWGLGDLWFYEVGPKQSIKREWTVLGFTFYLCGL